MEKKISDMILFIGGPVDWEGGPVDWKPVLIILACSTKVEWRRLALLTSSQSGRQRLRGGGESLSSVGGGL